MNATIRFEASSQAFESHKPSWPSLSLIQASSNGRHSRGCSPSGSVVMRKRTGLVTSRLVTSSIANVSSALCTALLRLSQ